MAYGPRPLTFMATCAALALWLTSAPVGRIAEAEESTVRDLFYRNGFDDGNASWQITERPTGPTVLAHRRWGQNVHGGAAAEQFAFVLSQQQEASVELSHELPISRVFDEVAGSVWVRCNRLGLQVGLQLRFPEQIDPGTGKELVAVLLGDSYSNQGEWQQLHCRTTDSKFRDLVRQLRNSLRQQADYVQIDERSVVVERIVVQVQVPDGPGPTTLALDDLEFGPCVAPVEKKSDAVWQQRAPLEQKIRATIGDDQLLIDGRPEVLLFTPYHGEEIDALARMGFNVVWIDRYDDVALLDALKSAGLFAMANPLPHEMSLEEALKPDSGLVAFTDATSQIAFWNMGARLSPAHLQTEIELMGKVREADARFRRPILIDVVGAEREFHRYADLISSSRHILHTTADPLDYFALQQTKRRQGLPDQPMGTLIQTEPSDANLLTHTDGRNLPVIEPEQIWIQGYAALAAGYKALGFWKMTSLTATSPGNDERRLAISLFNSHVQLLQPWLATAKFVQMVPATVESARAARPEPRRMRLRLPDKSPVGGQSHPTDHLANNAEIQVAVFRCDQGFLLLPVWYEPNAQFQPGPMAADELSFVVTIGCENAQAWEVTTTSVTPLRHAIERGAGSRIRLTNFNQFSAIVLTQGKDPVVELKQRAFALQSRSARDWVDLAIAKTKRVEDVHAQLSGVSSVPSADWMLRNAQSDVNLAERLYASGDYDGARQQSRHALLLTRIVQRRHWEKAMADAELTAGVSSPHTICFQTLPNHWEMVAEIGRRAHRNDNLLRSGDFEDAATIAEVWQHDEGKDPRVRPYAELYGRGAAQGNYCLHLLAEPVEEGHPPDSISVPPETFVSPPIPVYTGQIVHISGKVQIATPVTANPDGLMIYESTKGAVGALRWSEPTPRGQWQSFQLIREITSSQDLQLTIELRGLGDVRIDDLRVIAIDPN